MWFIEITKEIGKPFIVKSDIFLAGCVSGNINMVKFLYDKAIEDNQNIYLNENDNKIIKETATLGNLEIVKFLYGISNVPVIFKYLNFFADICKAGHLDVAKFIYEKSIEYGSPINIHYNDDEALAKSPNNVREWLMLLSLAEL